MNLSILAVNCKWSEWTKCSKTCGYGMKTRYTEVHASNGGQECQGPNRQTCYEMFSCPQPPGKFT